MKTIKSYAVIGKFFRKFIFPVLGWTTTLAIFYFVGRFVHHFTLDRTGSAGWAWFAAILVVVMIFGADVADKEEKKEAAPRQASCSPQVDPVQSAVVSFGGHTQPPPPFM